MRASAHAQLTAAGVPVADEHGLLSVDERVEILAGRLAKVTAGRDRLTKWMEELDELLHQVDATPDEDRLARQAHIDAALGIVFNARHWDDIVAKGAESGDEGV